MAWLPKIRQPGTSHFLGSEEEGRPWRGGLSLHGSSQGEASSRDLLHDRVEDQRRAGVDHCECGQFSVDDRAVRPKELVDGDGCGLDVRVGREDEGDEEVPPGRGEDEDEDHQEARFHQR